MDKLSFLDFSSTINGIVVDASFSKESIKEIFIPSEKALSSVFWNIWRRTLFQRRHFKPLEWTVFIGNRNIC